MKEINETRNYFIEEIKQNKLIIKKHKKVWKNLNYIENLLILASIITGCVSISAFASLISISVGIAGSTVGISAVIKKHNSRSKKKKKKHNKLVLLARTELVTV